MLRRFLGAHRAAAWGSPVGRRGPKSHCSFPSADFGRVHVFVWSMVARCQAIHHSFRASNITFRTHAGGRRVFPDAALEGSLNRQESSTLLQLLKREQAPLRTNAQSLKSDLRWALGTGSYFRCLEKGRQLAEPQNGTQLHFSGLVYPLPERHISPITQQYLLNCY